MARSNLSLGTDCTQVSVKTNCGWWIQPLRLSFPTAVTTQHDLPQSVPQSQLKGLTQGLSQPFLQRRTQGYVGHKLSVSQICGRIAKQMMLWEVLIIGQYMTHRRSFLGVCLALDFSFTAGIESPVLGTVF